MRVSMRSSELESAGPGTRERIIEAAEILFAERGVEGVSMRELTSRANVNLAAIHYHFGTKEALLEHVFELRAQPIAQRRLMMLAACRRDRNGCIRLRDLLEAFLRPALEMDGDNPTRPAFMRLRARVSMENNEVSRAMLKRAFDASSQRFIEELQKTLPDLPRKEIYWRFHFLVGAMTYTLANPGRIQELSKNVCDPSDVEESLRRLIAFAMAALAPPAEKSAPKPAKSDRVRRT